MPYAAIMIPSSPSYRRDAFEAGLKRLGYSVEFGTRARPTPADIIVVWNRRSANAVDATKYEKIGATVLVTENGWIGADDKGNKLYALAKGHHNGAGWWPVGNEDRWTRLGIELKPWRKDGRHILVLPQRGIGEPGVAMPRGWAQDAMDRLKAVTRRPVKLRQHPGFNKTPLEPVFEDCWAAVTWASGAAIKAIVAGIPVFHEMPSWLGGPAARRGIADMETPYLGDRMPMLNRLSHGQWGAEEIKSGEPFARLLELK